MPFERKEDPSTSLAVRVFNIPGIPKPSTKLQITSLGLSDIFHEEAIDDNKRNIDHKREREKSSISKRRNTSRGEGNA